MPLLRTSRPQGVLPAVLTPSGLAQTPANLSILQIPALKIEKHLRFPRILQRNNRRRWVDCAPTAYAAI